MSTPSACCAYTAWKLDGGPKPSFVVTTAIKLGLPRDFEFCPTCKARLGR